ncbi:hypothetical protein T484DRAFT_1839384 [Baffinella frigidus]|nr:hypothetical protein T484DRAFT_1839384 [Cryptophyta sp. CCMP2293]
MTFAKTEMACAQLMNSVERAMLDLQAAPELINTVERAKLELEAARLQCMAQLINTVERAKLELEAARLQFQEQKLAMERKFAAFEQMKNEEVLPQNPNQ